MATNKEWALAYAKKGIPVFPMTWIKRDGNCSCRLGALCNTSGKHPIIKNWAEEASTDEAKVTAWWTNTPGANIGIPTGERSGFVALDVDPRHGGGASLDALITEHGALPETVTATTGGGGKHYIFKYTDKLCLKNAVGFREGLDIRTQGGLIVVAPSIHASGNRYKWDEGKSPFKFEAAEMPEWLIGEIRKVGAPFTVAKKISAAKRERKEITEGGRNNHLASLAGTLRRKGMSADGILAALLAENQAGCNPPLDGESVKKIAGSIASYESGNTERDFKMTDVGNAERFQAMFGDIARYCQHYKKWFIWNGQYWARDDENKIQGYAIEAVRSIIDQANLLPESDYRKALINHSLRSESSGKLDALIKIATGLKGIAITPECLDANPWLLNTKNGVIDLRSGKLLPHDPKYLITKICKAAIDPNCKTPLWDGLLSKITEGNEFLSRYIQKAIGYALSGDISEQAIFILYGNGSNGKSTLLNVIGNLLGEYAQNTPAETFMQKKNEGVNNDVARLKGARFVTAIEVEEGKRLAESLVKSMTGGDKLTTRFLYGEFFDYEPQFKVFLACNHKPNIRDNTNSIWRRIKLLPFTATISEHERDKKLPLKIQATELPGILAWAVQGCLAWQNEGLGMPDTVQKATEEYRSEMDTFGAFLEEACVIENGVKVSNSTVRGRYKEWCEENGDFALGQKAFRGKLQERGIEGRRSGRDGSIEWHGVRMKGAAQAL
jgi:putative DNA primase/helicase